MGYTCEEIEAMEKIDVRSVDPETLRDIREVILKPN